MNPIISLSTLSGDVNKLVPLRDRILIAVKPIEGKTAGGIVINADRNQAACVGIVIAKGEGLITADGSVIPISDIQIGDTVVFAPSSAQLITDGQPFKGDKPTYALLREGQIQLKVTQ
jgi:chaperonin GroES